MIFMRLFLVVLLFPAVTQAQQKFDLNLLKPIEVFSMKAGDQLDIEFTASTSIGQYYYAVFLKHADDPPWSERVGSLTLEAIALKQGLNSLKWDGYSVAGLVGGKAQLVKRTTKSKRRYFIKIRIFDSKQVRLVGEKSNAHIKEITSLRTKAFTIQP